MKKPFFSILESGTLRHITYDATESLLESLLRNKVDIGHSCEGMGSCTTCRVVIRSELSEIELPNEIELERINERGFAKEERLACQIAPVIGLIIEIPRIK